MDCVAATHIANQAAPHTKCGAIPADRNKACEPPIHWHPPMLQVLHVSCPEAADPIDHRADSNREMRRHLAPPQAILFNRVTTRSRRSREYGDPIHAGLLPSQQVDSETS
jgi:hypothetical protein